MQSEPDSGSSPNWPRLLLAPWLGTVRPAAAAGVVARATAGRFRVVYAAHVALLALIVVVLELWDATVRQEWVRPPAPPGTLPTSVPTTNPAALGYVMVGWTPELRSRSFAEVWRDWHADGVIGPAELTFLLALVIIVVGTAFLAWLYLPRVHRAGTVTPAFGLAFRAVATAGGLLITLTFVAGLIVVSLNHAQRLGAAWPAVFPATMLVFIGFPIAIALILQRIGRASASVAPRAVDLYLPPRCEGCGYDLSHQPFDARCPECGLVVAESLSPARRPGCSWEKREIRRTQAWGETTQMAVLLPREFYGKLRLRTAPAAAAAFAVRNYVLIGIGAGLWVLLMWWAEEANVGSFASEWEDVLPLLLAFVLWVPLMCWFGHRLIGAIVITWWIARRSLPDTRWAAKVLAYESAYLWVFCAFWGVLATSFVITGRPWISELFGEDFFYAVFAGTPGEVVVALGGTGLLALAWLWRYIVALRAVRWSNY
jgi:hypothetical protein